MGIVLKHKYSTRNHQKDMIWSNSVILHLRHKTIEWKLCFVAKVESNATKVLSELRFNAYLH